MALVRIVPLAEGWDEVAHSRWGRWQSNIHLVRALWNKIQGWLLICNI